VIINIESKNIESNGKVAKEFIEKSYQRMEKNKVLTVITVRQSFFYL
jgi:hypothetical protein